MAQKIINVGSAPDDGTGDTIRDAFINVNFNFTDLYTNVSTRLSNTSGISYKGSLFFANGNVTIGATGDYYPLTILKGGVTPSILAGVIVDGEVSTNNFAQLHIRNANTGILNSTDFVATSDSGSETTNYIDLGINGSTYNVASWTINGKNDGYLYVSDGNLSIGCANSTVATKYISFFLGGTLSSNEAMRIQQYATGANVGINTTNPLYALDVAGTVNVSTGLVVAGQDLTTSIQGLPGLTANVTNNTVALSTIFPKVNTSVQNNTTTFINTGYTVVSFAAGANVAAYTTWTPDPANGNYQYANSNGSFTLAAPTNNCAIDILFTNGLGGAGSGAGTITFSGFTAPSGGGGDSYATTANNKYLLMIRKINSVATYVWKALQ